VEQLVATGQLPDVRLGKDRLVITPLSKAVPDEIEGLAQQMYDLLPRIKLPDLLLEVDAWAPFLRHFTHLQIGESAKDQTALLAALLGEALNQGPAKMARRNRAMLTLPKGMRHVVRLCEDLFRVRVMGHANNTLCPNDHRVLHCAPWALRNARGTGWPAHI
jgi:hypothetical protein